MAIYTPFPHDQPPLTIMCVICAQPIRLSEATAGSLDGYGQQAYACDEHLHHRETWITTWALYDITQTVPQFERIQA
jgi:hypothetical protein